MALIHELQKLGQSIWIESLQRNLIASGQLRSLIDEGVTGVTTDAAAFHDAITQDESYGESIRDLLEADPQIDSRAIHEQLLLQDVRLAADLFRPVYDATRGGDGFVSVSVSPNVAYESKALIAEAQRLWNELHCANVMISVPATPQGMPAFETLIGEGINVNLDLIFSIAQYECVAEAYLNGVQKRQDPSHVRSVSSFSLSQLDSAVDRALADVGSDEALRWRGKAGIAVAKLADLRFREIFFGTVFQGAKARGAGVQRLLWADVNAGDIERLIGPGTIHSISLENLKTLREQDRVVATLEQGQSEAEDVLGALERMEISLHSIAQALVDECILARQQSFDESLAALEAKRTQILAGRAA